MLATEASSRCIDLIMKHVPSPWGPILAKNDLLKYSMNTDWISRMYAVRIITLIDKLQHRPSDKVTIKPQFGEVPKSPNRPQQLHLQTPEGSEPLSQIRPTHWWRIARTCPGGKGWLERVFYVSIFFLVQLTLKDFPKCKKKSNGSYFAITSYVFSPILGWEEGFQNKVFQPPFLFEFHLERYNILQSCTGNLCLVICKLLSQKQGFATLGFCKILHYDKLYNRPKN